MEKLYQVKDRLLDEIEGYADVGKLSKDDAMALKALTGSVDHLSNIIEKEEGYSGDYPHTGVSYRHGGSYARKRDSMGRYSSDGYSRSDFSDKLHDLLKDAPDERSRMEIKRLIDKM